MNRSNDEADLAAAACSEAASEAVTNLGQIGNELVFAAGHEALGREVYVWYCASLDRDISKGVQTHLAWLELSVEERRK